MKTAYSYLRFSTPEQQLGDSERRQLELSERYANELGLTLKTDVFIDRGVSSFHAKNYDIGALGNLVAAIKSGGIKKGDYLLVENIDRISRAEPMKAFDIIREIIGYGVTVITVSDRQEYSETRLNKEPHLGYVLWGAIQKAHSESLDKSRRIHELWNGRRDKAAKGIKTKSRCPSWFQWDDNKQEYVIVKEWAAHIKRIYKLSLDGNGQTETAKMMTKETGTTWTLRQIQRILNTREILGEKQFYIKDDIGNDVSLGDPIPGYYPRIISDKTWLLAKARREQANFTPTKRPENLTNLFSQIVKCPVCGGQMWLKINRGYHYLVCSNAWRVGTCDMKKGVNLKSFEFMVLLLIHKYVESGILVKETNIDNVMLERREVLQQQVKEQQTKIDNWVETLGDCPASARKALLNRIDIAESAIKTLTDELTTINDQLTVVSINDSNAKKSYEDLRKLLIDRNNDIKTRRHIRNSLLKIIDHITVCTDIQFASADDIKDNEDCDKFVNIYLKNGTLINCGLSLSNKDYSDIIDIFSKDV